MKVQRSTGDNGMMSIQQGGNAAWPLDITGSAAFFVAERTGSSPLLPDDIWKGKRKWQTTRNL